MVKSQPGSEAACGQNRLCGVVCLDLAAGDSRHPGADTGVMVGISERQVCVDEDSGGGHFLGSDGASLCFC